jgi:hypothetical protein
VRLRQFHSLVTRLFGAVGIGLLAASKGITYLNLKAGNERNFKHNTHEINCGVGRVGDV